MLEDEVDEKYYLSQEVQNRFKRNGSEDIISNKVNTVGTTAPKFRTIGQRDIVYGINGVMGTLVATDYKQPKQIIDTNYNKNLQIGELDIKGNEQIRRVYNPEGMSPTLNTMQGGNRQPKMVNEEYRVRKLTPKECWRLMGFSDSDFFKAKAAGLSDTQLYKQAGNSIVVPVLEGIFSELFK